MDFSKARLLDPGWWRRSSLLIEQAAREAEGEAIQLLLQHHLALAANSSLSEDSFRKIQDQARECLSEAIACRRPWEAKATAQRQVQAFRAGMDAYKSRIMDPNDPGFQAFQDEAILAMGRVQGKPDDLLELHRRAIGRHR